MLYSKLFSKTNKNFPKDEITKNAQLLVKAGYVDKLMAGVYSYLPLGLRVLRKIENIVREEMNRIGGQEVLLPALHPAENWKITGGWEGIDVLFKIKSRTQKDYVLGQSHEEVIAPLVKKFATSYKDFPILVYQIQNKYRDELRAKSGILRGRDFGMKDMYSFNLTQEDFEKHYDLVKKSYLKIYNSCGLTAKVTEASGGGFSEKISYEFMVLTEAGEDEILYCSTCDYCVNLTITRLKKGNPCPKCSRGKLSYARASEVGNVFDLGQKYTKAFDLYVQNHKRQKIYPIMGCYGIGTTRLMGVIVEKHSDQQGICWPVTVSPFSAQLIDLGGSKEVYERTRKVYQELTNQNIDILWDERNVSAGQKLSDADLLGMPVRLLVSSSTGDQIEWKLRVSKTTEKISLQEAGRRLRTITA